MFIFFLFFSFPEQNPYAITNTGNHSIFFSLKHHINPTFAVPLLADHLENKIISETLIAVMVENKDIIEEINKSCLKNRVCPLQ